MEIKEAIKHDQHKLPWHLLPFDALGEVVAVLSHGAIKYRPRNWESGLHYSRLYAACLRHLVAWWGGEEKDPESGINHLAHAGCCVLFMLALDIRKSTDPSFDDRPCLASGRT